MIRWLLFLVAINAYGAADLTKYLRDHTLDAPRCEKQDLMLLPLQYSIAQRGDRMLSWHLYCDYGVGKKPKPVTKRRRARRR